MFGSSPRLIAAYHVFHRLLAPRHPPVALSNLFSSNFLSNPIQFSKSEDFRPGQAHAWIAITIIIVSGTIHASVKERVGLWGCHVVEVIGFEPMTPCLQGRCSPTELHPHSWRLAANLMVGLGRLELPTSRLSGVRSSHLSYRPFVR